MWNFIEDDKNSYLKIKEIEYDNNYNIINCYIDITSNNLDFNKIIYGDNDIILGNLKKIYNEDFCVIDITYYNINISIPYENYFIDREYELFLTNNNQNQNHNQNKSFIKLTEIKYNKKKLLKIKIYIKK